MSIFRDVIYEMLCVLFPPHCPVCRELLEDNEFFICTPCRFTLPATGLWNAAENPMTERLAGLLPVRHASAFIWYAENSPWRNVVHEFKYNDKWLYGRRMGEWFGHELAESGLYSDVDVVVPVPLHWIRRMVRGYNQSEFIADGIARVLGVPVDKYSVVRRRNNPSQTRNSAEGRWHNVEGVFRVRRPSALRGKHILLVDDVFTTGATMISCGTAILKSTGEESNTRLSIATIAATPHSMAIDR